MNRLNPFFHTRHIPRRKHFLRLFLLLIPILSCLLFSGCGHTKSQQTFGDSADAKAFTDYTDSLFESLVASDYLTFHYTLSKEHGIPAPEAVFSFHWDASNRAALSFYENTDAALASFSKENLSEAGQLAYDTLSSYVQANRRLAEFSFYEEYLSPLNGVQLELPVLLAEYQFLSENDIACYLKLLSSFPEYLSQIAGYEKQKAEMGLFMSQDALLDVLAQCDSFLAADNTHFLYTTFTNRMADVDFLSENKKQYYISQNEQILMKQFFPAYGQLKESLSALAANCTKDGSMCHLPSGAQYYEALTQAETCTDYTMDEYKFMIETSRSNTLSAVTELLSRNPSIVVEEMPELGYDSAQDILEHLTSAIQEDFELDSIYPYKIELLDESLSESMAPAFYLTSPLDDLEHNVIYLNSARQMDDLELFTTLAHEGYPGHLYQNARLRSSQVCDLQQLLSFSGYTEGWATYAELLSYDYAGLDTDLAQYYRLNRIFMLGLYASMEIGVHYDGWDEAALGNFLTENGVPASAETIGPLYTLIEQNAGGYLKYFIGYLEIERLKSQAETILGTAYTDKRFHNALLEMGPSSFSVLEEYLPYYLEN